MTTMGPRKAKASVKKTNTAVAPTKTKVKNLKEPEPTEGGQAKRVSVK